MPRFKFTEDREITAFGVTFPKGKAVDVTDERIIAKLDGNSHFERAKGRKPKDAEDQS